MDNFQIETAQNISIHQNVAHVTTRMGSFLIDFLIILAYMIIATFIMGWIGYATNGQQWAISLLFYLPIFFYSLIFEVLMNGQTPGKYANKIRVVKLDGSKPTIGSYILRWMLRLIDIWLVSGSIATATILLNGKGQRLGGIASGTAVISEKKIIRLSDISVDNYADSYTPTFPQVTVLSDSDVTTIRGIFRNAKMNRNHKVILKLYNKIIELTSIKTDMKPMDFVDTVIKDYYYYTQQ